MKIKFKGLIIILSFLFTEGLFAQQPFMHTTSTGNISGHITTLNHSSTNGKSNALVFVSQRYGKYNNHQVGVWYNGGKWKIYQEDKAVMPTGTSFNVVAINPSDRAFQHKASTSNTAHNYTTINHPKCNNNPNAVLLITQNYKEAYNAKPIGVFYYGNRWAIFNQDKTPMPKGANFNVLVQSEGQASGLNAKVSIHQTNATNKKNPYGPYLSKTHVAENNAMLFITQNWKDNGPYNIHIPSVWYSENRWTIFNQDKKELPNNAKFNILAFGSNSNVPKVNNNVSSVAWITKYYDYLKDKPLNKIALPGSHDSGTHNLDGTWTNSVSDAFAPDTDDTKRGLSFLGPGYDKWAKAQERTIYQQLEDGIRYLDIRVCVDKSGTMKTCHGLYGVSLTTVINDIVKFVNKYPKEPILIDFNHFYDWSEKIANGKENEAGYQGIRQSKLNELAGMIERTIGPRLAPNTLNPNSTLKDLMATGRPLIVLWDKTPSGNFQQTKFWRTSEISNSWAGDIQEIRRDKINHLGNKLRANGSNTS